MTLAPVGTTGPEFEVVVERGKVREFAAATHATSSAYQDAAAVVPATFLVSSVFWAPDDARPPHGFDRKRLLHGEQEYVFHGPPPRIGQRLRAQIRISDRYERAGKRGGNMDFCVLTTEFRDETGALVAEQHSTFVQTAPRGKATD